MIGLDKLYTRIIFSIISNQEQNSIIDNKTTTTRTLRNTASLPEPGYLAGEDSVAMGSAHAETLAPDTVADPANELHDTLKPLRRLFKKYATLRNTASLPEPGYLAGEDSVAMGSAHAESPVDRS